MRKPTLSTIRHRRKRLQSLTRDVTIIGGQPRFAKGNHSFLHTTKSCQIGSNQFGSLFFLHTTVHRKEVLATVYPAQIFCADNEKGIITMKSRGKIRVLFTLKGKQQELELTSAEVRQNGVHFRPAENPNHKYFVKADEVDIVIKPGAEITEEDIRILPGAENENPTPPQTPMTATTDTEVFPEVPESFSEDPASMNIHPKKILPMRKPLRKENPSTLPKMNM